MHLNFNLTRVRTHDLQVENCDSAFSCQLDTSSNNSAIHNFLR